jgi:hypothetical protein
MASFTRAEVLLAVKEATGRGSVLSFWHAGIRKSVQNRHVERDSVFFMVRDRLLEFGLFPNVPVTAWTRLPAHGDFASLPVGIIDQPCL